ncbi:hypothetical protein [Roseivirga thermotolerans]|uniref:hypothetical protein n=1 Tax=Roseivirga thermotolerans TaxID=1758176 RepID=UPI00273DC182|nr:hypothetical protein [Roseivirga thermotolerans]
MKRPSNIVSEQELLAVFSSQNWGDLRIILIAHTIKRLIYRYGIRKGSSELKSDADTILSDVLSLIVLEKKRNWNQTEYSTFKDFVISVIDSHLYSKFVKKRAKEIEITDDIQHPLTFNKEEQIQYQEDKEVAFEILRELGAKDDELIVFECMADGVTKPELIRKDLGLEQNEFRSIWRRLKPRMEQLRIKFKNNG